MTGGLFVPNSVGLVLLLFAFGGGFAGFRLSFGGFGRSFSRRLVSFS